MAGDFYASEKSYTAPSSTNLRIELHGADGAVTVLKEKLGIMEGEIIDAAFLSVKELREFYQREVDDALKEHMLLSIHLKATMVRRPLYSIVD